MYFYQEKIEELYRFKEHIKSVTKKRHVQASKKILALCSKKQKQPKIQPFTYLPRTYLDFDIDF